MKQKILIVDDSKFLRQVIKEIVESAGHEVVGCAKDGLEALESYNTNNPNIVLMDITMPNMSGKECLAEILKRNQEAKIVMISALTNSDLEKECMKIGAKGFLSKSMNENPNDFRDAIIETIKKLAA